MRALVAYTPGDFRIEEVPTPVVPAGGRLIEVEAAGVCAADRMLWRGDGPWELAWPMVPGRELLGHDLETGDRLTVEVKVPCGRCRSCLGGRTHLCAAGARLGSTWPGAFADLVALPPGARVHRVPDELPLEAAALAAPMACALHAVRRAAPSPGSTVAVIGLGPVGALATYAARAAGAGQVTVITRTEAKAALARDLGVDDVLDVSSGALDVADVVLECSGDEAAIRLALDLAVPGGTVVLYGIYRSPATVDLNQISEFKELTVIGGHAAPGCFPAAIAMLSDVDSDLLVTGVRLLDDFRSALGPATHPRLKEVLVP